MNLAQTIAGGTSASPTNPGHSAPAYLAPPTGVAASPSAPPPLTPSLDEQIEAVRKLKELLDVGILTQDEFETKKRQVLGL